MATAESTGTEADEQRQHQQQQPQTSSYPLPAILTYPASAPPHLVAQGAEGRVYKTTYLVPDLQCAFKYRPPKPYRHPILDQRLTRQRILAEARVLVKCRQEGVPVPAVYGLDENVGWLAMEWIEGEPVRAKLNQWLSSRAGEDVESNQKLIDLMVKVGDVVGLLHKHGIVHGDLTTSNLMLRPSSKMGASEVKSDTDTLLDGDIAVIDFGLASQATQVEDRAVDLYVLERAFASTHPRAESLFDQWLLSGYKSSFKQAPVVLKRLEEVRMRGRKRSMLG
ncbi:kinase-like domain-containing protein [Zalerion maritima]|uniref:EKC/KEOPS complex subunit BUD32 n=1 Tax=Zalerion maritima TaxID=339359 RepID=A0AAD5RU10_9PEZI|nr:kinase-like domain-containing protein [Zalerion maritima]